MARVSIKRNRNGQGYVGSISMRSNAVEGLGASGVGDIGDDVEVTVSGVGSSGADALLKAGSVLTRITDDPVMKAILPPQAQMAIATTKLLASAAKKGLPALKSVFGRLRGKKKKKKLVRALAKSTPRGGSPMRMSRGRQFAAPAPAEDYGDDYPEEEAPAPAPVEMTAASDEGAEYPEDYADEDQGDELDAGGGVSDVEGDDVAGEGDE